MSDYETRMKSSSAFDENGHRIKRNPDTTHRFKPKVSPINPDNFRGNFVLPIELVAKLRQYCEGKETKAVAKKGCKIRKPMRQISISDIFREYAEKLTAHVQLRPDMVQWVESIRAKNLEIRERQDAMIAAGINRMPKDQQLKRGNKGKKAD